MVDFWTKKSGFSNDHVRYEKPLLPTYKPPQAGPFPPHDMWETFKPFSKSAKNMIFLRVGWTPKRGGPLLGFTVKGSVF